MLFWASTKLFEGPGKMKDFEAMILFDPEAVPKFCTVPLAMLEKVKEELQHLTQQEFWSQ